MLLSRYVLLIQVPFLTYSHNAVSPDLAGTRPSRDAGARLAVDGVLRVADRASAAPAPDARPGRRRLGLLATFLHGIVDARQYVDLWTGLPLFVLLGLHAALVAPGETAPLKRLSRSWSAAAVLDVAGGRWRLRRGRSARRGRRISGPCGRRSRTGGHGRKSGCAGGPRGSRIALPGGALRRAGPPHGEPAAGADADVRRSGTTRPLGTRPRRGRRTGTA